MNKKLGLPGKAKDRVAVLTGIHPTPCTTPFGDYYMSLQVPFPSLRWCCLRLECSTCATLPLQRRISVQAAPADKIDSCSELCSKGVHRSTRSIRDLVGDGAGTPWRATLCQMP